MILSSLRESALGAGSAGYEFTGSDIELAEMQVTALTECNNITMALARMEYSRALNESAVTEAMLHEGVAEWFKGMGETIKKWWLKFKAWFLAKWTAIKDVFVKRKDWLDRHAKFIRQIPNEKLKDVKVKIGEKVATTDALGRVANILAELPGKLSDMVSTGSAAEVSAKPGEGVVNRFKSWLGDKLKARVVSNEVSEMINEEIIGKEVEVQLTAELLNQLIESALESYKVIDASKNVQNAADSILKAAENAVAAGSKLEGNDEALTKARVEAVQKLGPPFQSAVSSILSACSSSNAQAMRVITGVSNKMNKTQEESTRLGILEQFMVV